MVNRRELNMSLTRVLALRSRTTLMRLSSSHGESTKRARVVLNENNQKVKAYKSLVRSRLLWEQSGKENRDAFQPLRALREVAEPLQHDAPARFKNYEAPERSDHIHYLSKLFLFIQLTHTYMQGSIYSRGYERTMMLKK